ncbi:MAG TPA: MOSC domain-containing protein [Nitrospirales bacterium]|nr:MOSC domain-containing protein [Nitrospirales bacterium]HIB55243.1 MOSC domain-containing protein [Nitrospirales bacterium]HIO22357.1 MOSC domain-containing protein [Nitrospirales bacterium]
MRVVSVNVGTLRTIPWRGRQVQTGIFKHSINTRVAVRSLGIEGDQQADRRLHGGVDKAVYVYPKEHYQFWEEQYPDITLPWGMFGENLTIEGTLEGAMHIGDRWRIGSVQFEIVQPRDPCYKLGVKFGSPKIIKQFLTSGRSGWYLKVIKEGELGADDEIVPLRQGSQPLITNTKGKTDV